MKVAQDQGTLVLLQNLDPAYTSSEVEVVIWIRHTHLFCLLANESMHAIL